MQVMEFDEGLDKELNNDINTTKKYYLRAFIPYCLALIFLITTIIFMILYINIKTKKTEENQTYKPTKNQFIEAIEDYEDEYGAKSYQGKHDILNSKYFKWFDIYNMKSSNNLIILENFKTYQQTTNYTCGCASLIMVLNYLDGKIIGEKDCAKRAKTGPKNGTFPENLEIAIQEYGYDYESKRKGFDEDKIPSYDKTTFAEYIKKSLKNKEPIIICSNDLGGHYTVIIGYDDMGTDIIKDDVVIVADPFDTSDHISDGYAIWSYERLYAQLLADIANIEGFSHEFIKVKKNK